MFVCVFVGMCVILYDSYSESLEIESRISTTSFPFKNVENVLRKKVKHGCQLHQVAVKKQQILLEKKKIIE